MWCWHAIDIQSMVLDLSSLGMSEYTLILANVHQCPNLWQEE